MNIILIVLAVAIIFAVMFQSRGNGLSIVPTSNDFGKFERRGPEKVLYQGTAVLIVVFILVSIVHYFIS